MAYLSKTPGSLAGDTVTLPDSATIMGKTLITLESWSVWVHVQEGKTRIISMRKANAREQEIYQKRLGQG